MSEHALPAPRSEPYDATVPFPDPVMPERDPFRVIPAPAHLSNEIWQTSYYDATSAAPMGLWVQRAAGPCNMSTGRVIDGDWPHGGGPWQQV